MVDQYTDSDEPSVGHRKLFFDIEVEVTEGFPDVMKAHNMITSIALYDDTTSTYFTFVITFVIRKSWQNPAYICLLFCY